MYIISKNQNTKNALILLFFKHEYFIFNKIIEKAKTIFMVPINSLKFVTSINGIFIELIVIEATAMQVIFIDYCIKKNRV